MTTMNPTKLASQRLRHSDPAEMAGVAAARRGNQHAFNGLTEPYRRELQLHCYRILGSRHDAEDQVQETLLRAWRRLDTYAGRASFRAWLYKIATNACLDALDRRRARRTLPPQAVPASDPRAPLQPPAPEPTWLEPIPEEWLAEAVSGPEARYTMLESVSLAFLAALQALPPRQRAVLILSDVLDWPVRDVAELLEVTPSAVNSALHRARVTLAGRYHDRPEEVVERSLTDPRTRQLLDRYVRIWQDADVPGLVALLKEDAAFAMPPSPSWYDGPAAIGAFASATVFGDDGVFHGPAKGRWQLRAIGLNGQPGFALYRRAAEDHYEAYGVMAVTLSGDQIAAITFFLDPALPPAFGQPTRLDR